MSNILPSPPLPIILIRIPERMLFAKRHELRVEVDEGLLLFSAAENDVGETRGKNEVLTIESGNHPK